MLFWISGSTFLKRIASNRWLVWFWTIVRCFKLSGFLVDRPFFFFFKQYIYIFKICVLRCSKSFMKQLRILILLQITAPKRINFLGFTCMALACWASNVVSSHPHIQPYPTLQCERLIIGSMLLLSSVLAISGLQPQSVRGSRWLELFGASALSQSTSANSKIKQGFWQILTPIRPRHHDKEYPFQIYPTPIAHSANGW